MMSICHSVIVICCILVVAVDGFRHGLAPRSGHRSQVTALSAANNNGFGVQKVAQKVATALIAAVCSTGVIDPSWAAVEYLKQPTSDFKDEEKTVAEFKKAQQKIRNEWDAVIARLESSNDPLTTETALKDLKGILTKYNFGIPTGVKKNELVKSARAKKYILQGRKQIPLPTWSLDSEIAYQALIQEFNRQVLPNNKVENKI